MKQFNKRKVAKPAILLIALILAFPIKSLASEVSKEPISPQDEIVIQNSEDKDEDQNLFDIGIEQKLSEDNKKVNYGITITKKDEQINDLNALISIPKSSNLYNVNIEDISSDKEITKDDIKNKKNDDFHEILFDLKDSSVIRLNISFDIKENSDDDLAFDLALESFSHNYKSTYRINSYIKDKNLEVKENNELTSLINGEFVSDELVWTDYLINTTDKDLEVKYPIKLSDNQNYDESNLNLEIFELEKEGYKSIEKGKFELGDISGLLLNPHSIVKISFQTKVEEGSEEFTFNGKKVSRIIKEDKSLEANDNKEMKTPKADKKESTNSVLNLIDEITEGTEETKETIADDDKKNTDRKIETSKYNTDKNEANKENTNVSPESLTMLTEEIKKANEEIKDLIRDKEQKDISSSNDNKEVAKLSNNKGNRDVDVLISEITNGTKEIQELIRDKDPDAKAYDRSLLNTGEDLKSQDIKTLTTEITSTTEKIDKILREVESSIKEDIEKNPKDLNKLVELLDEMKAEQDKSKNLLENTIDEKTKDPVNYNSRKELVEKYPMITNYLINLKIRSGLLKTVK